MKAMGLVGRAFVQRGMDAIASAIASRGTVGRAGRGWTSQRASAWGLRQGGFGMEAPRDAFIP
jgi:hypothetical protein